jgi:hypothetical protein
LLSVVTSVALPFSTDQSWPFCPATKIRPSGAMSMAVGLSSPPTTCSSVNPSGTSARSVRASSGSVALVGRERYILG